jgi:hypothetical protein
MPFCFFSSRNFSIFFEGDNSLLARNFSPLTRASHSPVEKASIRSSESRASQSFLEYSCLLKKKVIFLLTKEKLLLESTTKPLPRYDTPPDLFAQSVISALLGHDPVIQEYRTFFSLFDWSLVEHSYISNDACSSHDDEHCPQIQRSFLASSLSGPLHEKPALLKLFLPQSLVRHPEGAAPLYGPDHVSVCIGVQL